MSELEIRVDPDCFTKRCDRLVLLALCFQYASKLDMRPGIARLEPNGLTVTRDCVVQLSCCSRTPPTSTWTLASLGQREIALRYAAAESSSFPAECKALP